MERVHITKVVKIGSSLGVVLPKEILAACMWDRGDYISFGVIAGPTLVARQLGEMELRRLKPSHDIN